MVDISQFLSRLLPQVPGCSEPLAYQSLVDSAIEFCEKSLAIRQDLDAFFSVDSRRVYDLDPPTINHSIARVISVTADGRPLTGIFEEDVSSLGQDYGRPLAFHTTRIDNEFVLNLYPIPDERLRIVVHAALKPTRAAQQLDDDLFNNWADAIIDGAISRIARIPNQPFSDVNYASTMASSAREKISRARIEAYHGRVRGGTSVKQRPFA